MSFAYAGTGALKVDFTKTGKVTLRGKYNDGINAVMRYFINNFYDAEKQDAIDLLVGNFRPHHVNLSPFKEKEEVQPLRLVTAVFLTWLSFAAVFVLVLPLNQRASLIAQVVHCFRYALVSTVLFLFINFLLMFKKGTKLGLMLARRPRLVLELESPKTRTDD
jgi:phosphatidylinositol 4-phosphatase